MSDGLFLLDKPRGVSSFRALAPAKRLFATRKIGHTGTLDPFATGLMVVLVGRATRLAQWLLPLEKRYEATVRFGEATDTLDPEGTVVETGPLPDPTDVDRILSEFTGEIEQVPPAYSAVKVAGERAYRVARRGGVPTVAARRVVVSAATMAPIDTRDYELSLTCGSGTYVRSLARDIAGRLGTVAHLTHLRRVAVGPFHVDNATSLEEEGPVPLLLPIGEIVPHMPGVRPIHLSERQAEAAYRGVPIAALELPPQPEGDYVLLSESGAPVAIAAFATGRWRYRWVLGRL